MSKKEIYNPNFNRMEFHTLKNADENYYNIISYENRT